MSFRWEGRAISDAIPPRPDVPVPPEVPLPPERVRPHATWRWWEALLVYLAGFLVAGLVTIPLSGAIHARATARLVATIAADLVVTGVVVWWLQVAHRRWRGIMGFPRRLGPEIRAGLAFGLGLYPVVAFGVGIALNLVLRAATGEAVRAPRQLPSDLGGGRIVLAVLLAVVVAPVAEELFYRGCLFRALRDRYGFAAGALGSAIVFGLVHFVPAPWQDTLLLMSVMVFTGLGLAYIYERRGNLVASIAAHATFNVVGLVFILVLR